MNHKGEKMKKLFFLLTFAIGMTSFSSFVSAEPMCSSRTDGISMFQRTSAQTSVKRRSKQPRASKGLAENRSRSKRR